MILYKVTFGSIPAHQRNKAEELIDYYLSALAHNGQLYGDWLLTMHKDQLQAYLPTAGIQARNKRYHCQYGRKWLKEIVYLFKQEPQWDLIDDDSPKQDTTWTKAPFLYLTFCSEWDSPLYRGDNGRTIPLYRVPGKHEHREMIYFWKRAYQNFESIWYMSRALEIPSYKELASPDSDLSTQGRDICQYIENAIGIPVYYYLMRYWGRRQGEEKRKCPGCGRNWRTIHHVDNPSFHHFHFKCDHCRFVSHLADCCYDNQRYAVIGEWKPLKE